MPGLYGVEAVEAGQSHSLALKHDGTLVGWGLNAAGALGTGTDRREAPVKVVNLSGAVQGSLGTGHTVVVLQDGTVSNWGDDTFLYGSYLRPERSTPELKAGLTGAVSAAAGAGHSLVLRADGTVWGWGVNSLGQLGDDTGSIVSVEPTQAAGITGAVAVAAGSFHSLALRPDGTVWSWGANWSGQLGGDTQDFYRDVPTLVPGLEGITSIAAEGDYTVALREDGSVWWLGGMFGSMNMPNLPQQVPGLPPIASVALSSNEFIALAKDGTLWRWMEAGPGEPPYVLQISSPPGQVTASRRCTSRPRACCPAGSPRWAGARASPRAAPRCPEHDPGPRLLSSRSWRGPRAGASGGPLVVH